VIQGRHRDEGEQVKFIADTPKAAASDGKFFGLGTIADGLKDGFGELKEGLTSTLDQAK